MIEIRVIGLPAAQGNHRAGKNGYVYETTKNHKPWREAVKWAAFAVVMTAPSMDGPVECEMVFSLPRPKSAPKRIQHPDKKPDLSKLIRSTEDALTDAGVWADDARVVMLSTRKVFAGGSDPDALPVPGAVIRVRRVE